MAESKVTVKGKQTLAEFAKANGTTSTAILADPRNAVIAARVKAGQTPIFNNSKVAIPNALPKSSSTPSGVIPGYTAPQIYGIPVNTGDVQGPMIGANLGKDAAAVINSGAGDSLNPEQLKAGQKYNTDQGLNSDGTKKDEITVDQDAYAILKEAFESYDLGSLVGKIEGYMKRNLGANQARLELVKEPEYLERFDGNVKRLAQGKNAISEARYLELENDYSETLSAYGISDYFGVATDAVTRKARQKKMAEVIGNDISADEFKTRVSTAVGRVKNSDANTKTAFKALYGIGDTELVKFFLDPKQGADELKIKANAAEISGAASTAGLSGTSLGAAEELARLGVDKAEALTGYGTIAGYLQRSNLLGDIYKESGIRYGRDEGEADVFKQNASAKRKREMLSGMETASFSGESGRLRTGQMDKNTGQF